MKEILIFVVGLAATCASAAATAQDLTAGKTPAQLFRSDCAECHRSPSSVGGTRDVRALAEFLREHYTTKAETAGALAAYVSSFAGTGPAMRNRGTGLAAPVSGEPVRRRNRGQGDATAADARNASPIEDTAPRRRRGNISGDAETQRAHTEEDVSPPPGATAATPASSKSTVRTRNGKPRDARGPVSRLRSDARSVPSEQQSESGNVSAGRTAGPRARKRRNAAGDVVAPAAEAPAAGTPRQEHVSPAAAPITAPRVEP